MKEHTHEYSALSIDYIYISAYLEHILVTKHIQTPRYIHDTILNIFKKAQSWMFNTVLDMSHLFLIDAI